MNICRFVWDFPPREKISYGLGPNFYYISREQVKQGANVHVIALRRNGQQSYEEMDGIHVHRTTFPYNIQAIRKLRDLDSSHNFDIIHGHGTCGISYVPFRTFFRRPLVAQVHGTTLGAIKGNSSPPRNLSLRDFSKSKLRETLFPIREYFFWRGANKVVAVSKSQKKEISSLYRIDPSRIDIAYNGVDPSVFKNRKREATTLRKKLGLEGKRVILFVGHFGFRKGILYLYRAMREVLEEVPDVALLCIGGAPKWLGTDLYWDVVHESRTKYGLTDHVTILGQTPHHELPIFYSLADVFAFPTLYEGLPKVVIESISCETPVVASAVGGIPEIIEHGREGFLTEPKDVVMLSKYLIQLLQDRRLSSRMGRRGREKVLEKFTWDISVRSIFHTYDGLLHKR